MQLCAGVVDCLVGPLLFAPTQRALLAAIIIGIICAVMGAFVVIQNLAFIGDALAHAAFPGVVIAAPRRTITMTARVNRIRRRSSGIFTVLRNAETIDQWS